MIEAIMYAAIGFLTATLLALLALPAVWRRAVRLTRKRIEGAIPVSVAEVQADKDEQRAIFAVDVRRLELEVNKLQNRAASQWTDVTRQAEELRTRQETIDRLAGELTALQTEHSAITAERDRLASELDIHSRDLAETRAALQTTSADLAETRIALEETSAREDEFKIDHVALTTLRDTLKDRIGELDRNLAATNTHLTTERNTLRTTSESLSVELTKNRQLREQLADTEARLATLDREAAALRTERAALTAQVAALEARALEAEQARAATEAEASRLTGDARQAQRTAEALAREAADTIEMLRAEKAMLDDALAKARDDRAGLQQQLDHLLSLATTIPATPAGGVSSRDEADDTALLRERISDIAAEVAHLTARLEGPGSPIDVLLASHAPAANGASPTLADRILALRTAEDAAQDPAPPQTAPKAAAPKTSAPRSKGRAVAG